MKWLVNGWWSLVRFGFRLLYNELAFTYDGVSYVVSLGEWRSWQRTALEFLPTTPDLCILELAHGTGHLQIDLNRLGYTTIGYDLSPYMGRITQRRLERLGITPLLVNGRAEGLPFKKGSLHAIISTFPTNFIFTPQTLAHVYRVLADDGVLIVVLNGVLTGSGLFKTLIDGLYGITGQTENAQFNVSDVFEKEGFIVSQHDVPCKKSYAQVIVARKTK